MGREGSEMGQKQMGRENKRKGEVEGVGVLENTRGGQILGWDLKKIMMSFMDFIFP